MSKLTDKVIKGFITRLEKSEKFVLEQAPDIAKEMILKVVMESRREMAFGVVIGILSMFAGSICLFLAANTEKEADKVFLVLLCFTIFLPLLIMSLCTVFDRYTKLKYVENCPKLFLLKEFRKLL